MFQNYIFFEKELATIVKAWSRKWKVATRTYIFCNPLFTAFRGKTGSIHETNSARFIFNHWCVNRIHVFGCIIPNVSITRWY